MAAKSCKDTSDREDSNSESENLSTRIVSNSSGTKQNDLSVQLERLNASFRSSKDQGATLSTLKKFFDDIIQHPNDDNYR